MTTNKWTIPKSKEKEVKDYKNRSFNLLKERKSRNKIKPLRNSQVTQQRN